VIEKIAAGFMAYERQINREHNATQSDNTLNTRSETKRQKCAAKDEKTRGTPRDRAKNREENRGANEAKEKASAGEFSPPAPPA
jgi:hypothetical protein